MVDELLSRIDPPETSVRRLAARLEKDIRRRGLVSGERYLTAAEAGEMLGVSLTTANRAMQELAKRNLLIRNRSSGSYVGPELESRAAVRHLTLHILFFVSRRRPPRMPYDELVEGVSSQASVASVKFTSVPEDDPVQFVKNTLAHDINSGNLFGVLAIGMPREVYRYLQDYDIPAVVLGELYPDTLGLPSVNVDLRQVGHLMAEYLIRRGHNRLALLSMEAWQAGDNLILEGIHRAMAAAALAPDALVVRSTLPEMGPAVSEIHHIMATDAPPTGFICRHRTFAEAVQQVAESENLETPRGLEFIVDAFNKRHLAGLDVACCLPEVDPRSTFARLGRMLCDIHEGKEIEPRHVLIPAVIHDSVPD